MISFSFIYNKYERIIFAESFTQFSDQNVTNV